MYADMLMSSEAASRERSSSSCSVVQKPIFELFLPSHMAGPAIEKAPGSPGRTHGQNPGDRGQPTIGGEIVVAEPFAPPSPNLSGRRSASWMARSSGIGPSLHCQIACGEMPKNSAALDADPKCSRTWDFRMFTAAIQAHLFFRRKRP